MFTLPKDNKLRVTADWVRGLVRQYESEDDVFQRAFLATVVFSGAEEVDVEFTEEAQAYLNQLGNRHVVFVARPSQPLLPGPYVLVERELRDVWKIMDDTNGTCVATLKPQSK